jgi:hypothetical protein
VLVNIVLPFADSRRSRSSRRSEPGEDIGDLGRDAIWHLMHGRKAQR